jgi:transposase
MDTEGLIGQLHSEIAALRMQYSSLQERYAEACHLAGELQGQNAQLREQLTAAEERIAELERAKKGPPSFIKPNKPKRDGPKAPRRKRAVGQNHGRARCEAITRREEHHVGCCPGCGGKLCQEREAWRREVVDVPPPQTIEVVEHVVYKGFCQRCATWHHAEPYLPGTAVGRRRFGVRLMALVGYLSAEVRMPVRVIREYLATLHGLRISTGALEDLRNGLAKQLQPQEEALQTEVRRSAIVHADETGWREDGQNGYAWVFSTPGEQGLRYYVYDRSRGQQVVEAFLGDEFQGVLGSDFYGAYNVYRGRHQRCWVHLLRDLHQLKEEHPEDESVQEWARSLRALYERGMACVEAGASSQEEREKLYVALVSEAEELGLRYARTDHPCRALSKRVLRHLDELFQFVLVAGLAADNNLAERSLRPLVVVRKISGGTRSPQGSRTRMTLATIFGTLHARGLNSYTECLALIRANCLT